MTRAFKQLLPAAIVLLSGVCLSAQSEQPPAAQSSRPAATPERISLKVSLVFSRYQGEKKISSVPHTLWVTTNDRTSLRLGTQIPVPTTALSDGKSVQSYQYRDVGTNIDCSASSAPEGAYRLTITITDSSVYYPEQADTAVRSATASTGAPAFRNFNSTFTMILRDGQTAQSTSVTDPVSGQVIKVDATINVQK